MSAALILDDFLPYRLSVASNLVSDAIASTYEALFGLKIPEWRVLAVVAENDGITQQAIGINTRMDKVTVSRAAIALVERGLCERIAHADDKRSHLLSLTGAGQELYSSVVPKALELERKLLETFREEELKLFVSMLRRTEAAALTLTDK